VVYESHPLSQDNERRAQQQTRSVKKNGGNNGIGEYFVHIRRNDSVFKNPIHVLKGKYLPPISAKSWF